MRNIIKEKHLIVEKKEGISTIRCFFDVKRYYFCFWVFFDLRWAT